MARPLSEDKRNAILTAATEAVAALGLGASTARIAKDAGVAEGSLFTYFTNKDDLLNQLYLSLKAGFRNVLITGYPAGASVKDRCRHLWDRSIDWGATSPAKRKAMRQLTVSDKITEQTRKTGAEGFSDMEAMLNEGFASGVLRQQPVAFIGGILESLTELVLEHIARDPAETETYKRSGFDAFWGAISAR
ncbi:TetR/AcrR family transcriptional regulator [Rhizobium sp. PL01]|uniref:TetR/AcrR family transcriptional regulator n=1 Tax=Rhizobium sp. PL01 TaxID=3085631 RepID=UPI0029818EB2|nr:TetR/AcrR family transcriptional regulator [Rhizobium sp. PL01]MDW5312522.1 TetR/AcrR family transcriptional regulator [Rhizobium sp. PL01]